MYPTKSLTALAGFSLRVAKGRHTLTGHSKAHGDPQIWAEVECICWEKWVNLGSIDLNTVFILFFENPVNVVETSYIYIYVNSTGTTHSCIYALHYVQICTIPALSLWLKARTLSY